MKKLLLVIDTPKKFKPTKRRMAQIARIMVIVFIIGKCIVA